MIRWIVVNQKTTKQKQAEMKRTLLNTLPMLVIIGGLFFVSCSQIFGPSLCQCIDEPGYKYYDKNVDHCKKLMKKEFGTKNPSVSRMTNYITNNCR